MVPSTTQTGALRSQIPGVVRKYWGFDRLRPLQEDAILAGLEKRDSLVVLPTGGGKSLCYQVPPVLAGRTDVVVSPLISLMKDQVDGLRQCGYPAAALNSGMPLDAIREAEREILDGKMRLVFVAPERLVAPAFQRILERLEVRAFSIDEAHCISHWGHDFRPEYRQLALLKERFPKASVHAYTATATPRVRKDIAVQLKLIDPAVLVGVFDRPNLVYRVVPRLDVYGQTLDVVRRHRNQAVIIYCISRRDTEEMASFLQDNKVKAAHYHAGMDADYRRKTQDDFAEERLDVVVATVAFGMGIDRSDVRCVIHAAMPKSVEHYQQETGRAGRDGLEAECVLLYSAADVMKWEGLVDKSAENAENPLEVIQAMRHLLGHMQRMCNAASCRHKALSEYFGQAYERENCGACDVCLEEMEVVPDSTVTAQKILSCVARVQERFGVGHVVDVLLGANTEMIRDFRHDQLSTYGLLKDMEKKSLNNLVFQLVDQGLVERTPGDRPILQLNEASWRVLRKQQEVKLLRPKTGEVEKTKFDEASWEGVDQGLFERLRSLRQDIAQRQGVPAYLVFGDASLRQMARVRPSTAEDFSRIHGVGRVKLAELGEVFLDRIVSYCVEHGVSMDQWPADSSEQPRVQRITRTARAAFELFEKGATIESVMAALGRAHSTTSQYLAEYIRHHRPASIDRWVDSKTYRIVEEKVRRLGAERLRPIYEALDGKVAYDDIRLVAAHWAAMQTSDSGRTPA
jgi:ATP-dependent DNA helicase RecQ